MHNRIVAPHVMHRFLPQISFMETALDFLGDLRRAHACGQLRASDAGSHAVLMGWVHRHRDLGGVIFIHLRDRYGVTQIVFHAEVGEAVYRKAEQVRPEYVIAVEGRVALRSPTIPLMPISETGEVELVAGKNLDPQRIPHTALPPGRDGGCQRRHALEIPLRGSAPSADAAQHHAALEDFLRRARIPRCPGVPRNRDALHDPLHSGGGTRLPGAQPRAARQLLCPATSQSPQIFKQLLMVSGFDKYFQMPCAASATRICAPIASPRFTQIDLEMSFPQEERILEVIEPWSSASAR